MNKEKTEKQTNKKTDSSIENDLGVTRGRWVGKITEIGDRDKECTYQ